MLALLIEQKGREKLAYCEQSRLFSMNKKLLVQISYCGASDVPHKPRTRGSVRTCNFEF